MANFVVTIRCLNVSVFSYFDETTFEDREEHTCLSRTYTRYMQITIVEKKNLIVAVQIFQGQQLVQRNRLYREKIQ
jgi:hypothetical protein